MNNSKDNRNIIINKLFEESLDFHNLCFEIFQFQFENNIIYQNYAKQLNKTPSNVSKIEDLPFLPISAFKHHQIQTGKWRPHTVFSSSGTTGMSRSHHHLRSTTLYHFISKTIFENHYFPLDQNTYISALLPSYQENSQSSLLFMTDYFGKQSCGLDYLFEYDYTTQVQKLEFRDSRFKRHIFIGVSFALLDLAHNGKLDLSNTTIFETGGMKGRKKEITRQELHIQLSEAFNTKIHSEYGMTELTSQFWTNSNGYFQDHAFAKAIPFAINDPFEVAPVQQLGRMNIIDFGNLDTCSFIATDDLGRKVSDSEFEILGRLDHSDTRGCSLLYL